MSTWVYNWIETKLTSWLVFKIDGEVIIEGIEEG